MHQKNRNLRRQHTRALEVEQALAAYQEQIYNLSDENQKLSKLVDLQKKAITETKASNFRQGAACFSKSAVTPYTSP